MPNMFIPFHVGDPDENDPQVMAFRAEQDRLNAEAEDFSNRVWSLLDERSAEDLATISDLLQSYLRHANIPAAIHYTLGNITALLKMKYGVCTGCGKDHAKELFEHPPVEPVRPEAGAYESVTPPPMVAVDPDTFLVKYNVTKLPDGRVQCNNCSVTYPSLADRMVRPPEDCHGCRLKSGHG